MSGLIIYSAYKGHRIGMDWAMMSAIVIVL
jgi:hypothetical protein